MPAIVKHINQHMPAEIPVILGAPEVLVTHRELRSKYETNRSIKTWSVWFLLKALTTSGKVQCWYKQKAFLLHYLQLNENTLRRRLKEMEQLQLVTVDDDGSINLISYEKAAGVLDIPYSGLYKQPYNPEKNGGKQIFQYILRGEEIRLSQQRQLDALMYSLDKNLSLKNDLCALMVKAGADGKRLLQDPRYFQERLLVLQTFAFKEGSAILDYIYTHRADINRGVLSIQKAHTYKATQSVSYLKKRMFKLGLIDVNKVCVRSDKRSRLYIPDGNGKRDGYKWIGRAKATALFLTDQISFKYETPTQKRGEGKAHKAA